MISDDPELQQELLRDAHASLHTVGGLEITLTVVGIAAAYAAGDTLSLQSYLSIALGLVTLTAARWERLYEWSVPVSVLSCIVWATMPAGPGGEPGNLIRAVVAMLVLASLLPLRWPAALVSLAVVGSGHVLRLSPSPGREQDVQVLAGVVIVGAAIASHRHRERRSSWNSLIGLVQSLHELRTSESTALAAGQAVSLEQLSAAVAHELNTPVGALKSSAGILTAVARKQPIENPRLAQARDEALKAFSSAVQRIEEFVRGMQRWTRLDCAQLESVDFNQLLRDTVSTFAWQTNHELDVRLDLRPLPTMIWASRRWNATVAAVLAHAHEHGARTVSIRSSYTGSAIRLVIEYSGRRSELTPTADPCFVSIGHRIGAGNWGLFHARQWVREEGGNLQIKAMGEAAIVQITIPEPSVVSLS